MILVDTSVWIDHFREANERLVELLSRTSVRMHPFIVGELASGNLASRAAILELLGQLPAAAVAEQHEVLEFVARRRLHGKGIGWVDVHLLASAALNGDQLWTRDRSLQAVAHELGCGVV